MIYAVHQSRIDARLRHLAQTLAIFADDEGGNVRPGIDTLQQAMGVKTRAIRYQLQALIDRRVLIRDGFYHRTRRYRFDPDQLAEYHPCTPVHGFAEARPVENVSDPCTPLHTSESDECTPLHTSKPRRVQPGAATSATPCRDVCNPVPRPVQPGAPDLNDLKDLQDLTTDAGASDFAPEQSKPPKSKPPKSKRRPARKPSPTTSTNGRETPMDDPTTRPAPGFPVYAAVAQKAFEHAIRERDESDSNVAEHAKVMCARQGIPYDGDVITKAVAAARVVRDKARGEFWDRKRSIGPKTIR
jgi:hypothetical protein